MDSDIRNKVMFDCLGLRRVLNRLSTIKVGTSEDASLEMPTVHNVTSRSGVIRGSESGGGPNELIIQVADMHIDFYLC